MVDIGCGPLGGFVPMLRANGYDAVGIDPQPPEQPHYRRLEFERAELPPQVDAVVASTSLHHFADPTDVIDRITSTLRSGGAVVIVEWAWEKFDEQTAACVSSGSDETTKQAGYTAAEMNGSPQAASGRATFVIGPNETGFILGRCCCGFRTSGSSASFSRTGLISFPISST